MRQRTHILADIIAAAGHLDEAQRALTKAYVALEGRSGSEARDTLAQVTAARDAVYDEHLQALIETAITLAGRMP